MKPSDLPCFGEISNWDTNYISRLGSLEGKRILCLGYSQDQIDELIVPLKPRDVQVLTLWPDHIDAKRGKYEITIGDITKRTPFDDGQFDAVVSLSLLEHVLPLEDAVCEMRRITRVGGENFHMFGPAWSCAYGSHLYVDSNDDMLNFSRWKLPAFMHLLCSKKEIREYYCELGYSESVSDIILDNMFFDGFINRVFYDQYIRILSTHFRIENAEYMTNDVPRDILSLLRRLYPGNIDFSTYGAKLHLIC